MYTVGWERKEAPPKRLGRASKKGQEEDQESVVLTERSLHVPRAVSSGINGCNNK